MTQYDRRGAEIHAGDYVVWFENRAGGFGTDLYQVRSVKNNVQLVQDDSDDFGRWVNPRSVFVVESVPEVSGRFNTKRGTKAWRKKRLQQ